MINYHREHVKLPISIAMVYLRFFADLLVQSFCDGICLGNEKNEIETEKEQKRCTLVTRRATL